MNKYLVLLFFYLIASFLHGDIFTSNFFELAKKNELSGNIPLAIEYYKKFVTTASEKTVVEKVSLKIARLVGNPKESINYYNDFLKKYPKSRYRYIARFELATILKICGKHSESIIEFEYLVKKAQNTSYWQKSLLQIIELQYSETEFDKALGNLYILLDAIDDYEDIGRAYYLLGLIMYKQKQYDDAQEFFLICAGSFPQSYSASSSLLALMELYICDIQYAKALSISVLINQLYTNSFDNIEAKKNAKIIQTKIKKNIELPTINLINLNEEENLKDIVLSKIKKEMLESNINIISKEKSKISVNGFYVQLGYYSSLESAKLFIKECNNKKGIKDVYFAKTTGSNDRIYYRIVIGPFTTRKEANNILILLKEKNIESIILELTKDYE